MKACTCTYWSCVWIHSNSWSLFVFTDIWTLILRTVKRLFQVKGQFHDLSVGGRSEAAFTSVVGHDRRLAASRLSAETRAQSEPVLRLLRQRCLDVPTFHDSERVARTNRMPRALLGDRLCRTAP